MKVSEKRKQAAYNAISESILTLRIELAKNNHDADTVDNMLFQLEQEIWRKLRSAMNIEGV